MNRISRIIFPPWVPRMILPRIELPKSNTFSVASSVENGRAIRSYKISDGSLIFESLLVPLESNRFCWSSDVKSPESTMTSPPPDVPLLVELGLKNLCRFSDNEPGIVHTFLCSVQADCIAVSSIHKVHSMDLPWMLERLDLAHFFGCCLDDSKCRSQVFPFQNALVTRWWSLVRNWVLSSDCIFRNCSWLSSFTVMFVAIVADFSFSSADKTVCLSTHMSPNLHAAGV